MLFGGAVEAGGNMCPAEDPVPTPQQGERRAVLVVDDEVLLRLSITDALRDHGFTVFEAASADEARELILAGVEIDAVFTDISMPGEMDGEAFVLWLVDNKIDVPVVMTSGEPGALRQARERAPHVKAFLPKPYDHDDVAARLSAALKGR